MSTSRQRPASHLLPTLFDRLCDDAPNQKRDHDISVSPVQLKEIIRRDLSFLLNTVSHEDDIDAARYPHAAASVLNYGLHWRAAFCMNTNGTISAGPFCVPSPGLNPA